MTFLPVHILPAPEASQLPSSFSSTLSISASSTTVTEPLRSKLAPEAARTSAVSQ